MNWRGGESEGLDWKLESKISRLEKRRKHSNRPRIIWNSKIVHKPRSDIWGFELWEMYRNSSCPKIIRNTKVVVESTRIRVIEKLLERRTREIDRDRKVKGGDRTSEMLGQRRDELKKGRKRVQMGEEGKSRIDVGNRIQWNEVKYSRRS